MTMSELKKYIGIRLSMAFEGSVESYWTTDSTAFSLPLDYQTRTGISLSRFSSSVMEEKFAMRNKMFGAEYGGGTAHVLRLCELWGGSRRFVVPDSAFASLKTIIAVHKELGMYFTGIVKTAHKSFPKAAMKLWFDNQVLMKRPRGNWVTFGTMYDVSVNGNNETRPAIALGWRDITLKMIITNKGATTPSTNPIYKHRSKVVMQGTKGVTVDASYEVRRPALVETLFEHFSAIDVHDYIRQGLVAIECRWRTHAWWTRLFGKLIGVAATNAFLMSKYEAKHKSQQRLKFFEFMDLLCYEMIHNDKLTTRELRSSSVHVPPVLVAVDSGL